MQLLLASRNEHKISELQQLLAGLDIHILSMKDFNHLPAVVEDGQTFAENARKKALEIQQFVKTAVLADDSGLEVSALDNQPGVYSARFSGEDATDIKNNQLLLERLKDVPDAERKARFVCVLCLKTDHMEQFFTGFVDGIILHQPKGHGGFGYDPLFYVPEIGKTFAELTQQEKSTLSHRGKAMQKFRDFLMKYGLNSNAKKIDI